MNVRWLMMGDGEMFFEKKEAPVSVVNEDAPVYERGGVLESALHRLTVLEDRVAELEALVRALGEGKGET